jgi:hypothetical protein
MIRLRGGVTGQHDLILSAPPTSSATATASTACAPANHLFRSFHARLDNFGEGPLHFFNPLRPLARSLLG